MYVHTFKYVIITTLSFKGYKLQHVIHVIVRLAYRKTWFWVFDLVIQLTAVMNFNLISTK